jgi:hypothetical protein
LRRTQQVNRDVRRMIVLRVWHWRLDVKHHQLAAWINREILEVRRHPGRKKWPRIKM